MNGCWLNIPRNALSQRWQKIWLTKEKTIKGECSAKACFRITEPQGLHNVQISTRLGTARREGIAEGEARGEAKTNKILKFLRSKGVSPKLLAAAQALK